MVRHRGGHEDGGPCGISALRRRGRDTENSSSLSTPGGGRMHNEPQTVFEPGREVSAGLDHAGSLTLAFPLQNCEKINVHGLTCPVVTYSFIGAQAD